MTDQISPEVGNKKIIPEPVKSTEKNYIVYAIIAAVLFFLISLFSGYSLKKQIDINKSLTIDRDTWKTKATSVTSISETDTPIKIGDTISFIKRIDTNTKTLTEASGNNNSTISTEHKKETITVKSSFGAGLAISTKGTVGVPFDADVLYIGIGTIRAMGLISKDEQWGGAEFSAYF
jgi:hypothetical protein